MHPLLLKKGSELDVGRSMRRFMIYAIGVFVLAFGISLQNESGLGTAAFTCFADTLSLLFGTSLGFMLTVTYVVYVLIQILIQQKNFKPRILLEFGFSAVMGFLTDFFSAVLPIQPSGFPAQVVTMICSIVVTAVGVSIVVGMDIVPNPSDGLVQVIAEKMNKRFGDVKVVLDISHVAASLLLSMLFLHDFGGFGLTTLLSALFLGKTINGVNKLFGLRLQKMVFNYSE